MKNKFILLIASILLFSSCGKDTGMRITTNTFANKEIIPDGFEKGTSFNIVTKQKGNELFTQEVVKKIATILNEKGFKIKTLGADYKLNFSFAMEKSTHTRDVPVYIPNYGPWYYYDYYPYYRYGYNVAYVPEQYNLYNKILLVEVYEKGLLKNKPVWQGTAHSYEEDSDLRDAIDYLLVTVFKYFGQNTPKNINSRMEENDASVNKLRDEYLRPTN
jgi:hypothetical protein